MNLLHSGKISALKRILKKVTMQFQKKKESTYTNMLHKISETSREHSTFLMMLNR